tara:strand:- start:577 stop:834 length:258 start_codon:yes stop_codon:yes gene_type:complete
MRKICTFNLDVNVIQDMNKEIRRGYRSDYVERAIKEKLKRLHNTDLTEFTTSRLLLHVRNTRFSELTDLDKKYLEDLIARLEGTI